jgi:2',3'-cyclic-nucleotide 2'-phosphodiesterase (5'-nucleotidase family)
MDGGALMRRALDREEPKAILTWKEMSRRGYDAVGLGEIEYSHWELVKQLMQEFPLPVVSTNVERLVDGQWVPVGEKYRILDVEGVKLGVIAVISEEQLTTPILNNVENELRVLPPVEEIESAVAELAPVTDIIVLLAHMDPKSLEQHASLLADVDVVLGGHVTQNDDMPLQIAKAIVNRSGTRGQVLATTRLIVSPQGEIVDFGGKNVTLVPGYREDPEVLAAVEEVMQAARPAAPQTPSVQPPHQPPSEPKVKEAERQGQPGSSKAAEVGQVQKPQVDQQPAEPAHR